MAQQELRTVITIGGKVDNTFSAIGDSLVALGGQIDQVSQKIINFGKDGVETYVQYDDAMRETQAVGGYTTREMERLDALNRRIAQTSTYTNLQSANAMVLIAQAGLEIADVEALIPETLDLAMAGNLGLADSVDYLISSIQSLGYEMDYADELVNQMAKTASIGMTDIDTLGESLMRLGSGAQMFAGGSVEILSILSAMSQFGHDQRGSQGGTWLRNFMLSLAAPAGSINDVVDAMEQLGVAQEEIDQYAEDHSTGAAAAAVQSLVEDGLRIYDEKDKLLPAIDIIKSLRDTVRGSGEYADDLTELTGALNDAGGDLDAFVRNTEGLTDNALYNVFAKIFGKRGITTALNLISISDEEWAQIVGDVQNSEGFAESMAEIMQGGLGGALREFEAAWTELKTTFGETIAPEVEGVADFLHDTSVAISNMDEDKLDAIVAAMKVLAVAGPGLMLTGGAFRLIGYLLTPAGGIGLGLAALTAAAAAMKELSEMDMNDNFGDMELNGEALSAYVAGLGEDFTAAYEDVNEFNAALEKSVEDYALASQTFSGDLLTAMLTSATLTKEDIDSLQGLGDQMYTHLVDGITLSAAASMSYFQMLFGGEGEAEYDPQYRQIIELTNQSYLDAIADAEELSQGLRDALTSAFDDGTVSQEEYAEIQSWMQSYNDAMAKAAAQAQAEEDYTAMQMLLHKAQTASYDEIKAVAGETQAERDRLLAQAEEEYLKQRFKLEYRYNQAIANGTMIDGRYVTEDDRDIALDTLKEQYEGHIAYQSSRYDDILTKLWESSMGQSELGAAYDELGTLADRVMRGELSAETAVGLFRDLYGSNIYAGESDFLGNNTRTQLGEYLARMIAGYGGYEGLVSKAEYYDSIGESAMAANLRRLYTMQQINDDFAKTGVRNYSGKWQALFGDSEVFSDAADEQGMYRAGQRAYEDAMAEYIPAYSVDVARRTIDAFGGENGPLGSVFTAIDKAFKENDGGLIHSAEAALSDAEYAEFARMYALLSRTYDFERVLGELHPERMDSGYSDYAAMYSLMYGEASKNAENYVITATVEPVLPEGAVEETADEISDGLAADAYIEGLYESAVEERASAQAYLSANPGVWRVSTAYGAGGGGTFSRMAMYAEGGRATEASVFGEDGAEWAIPEEHTANTASLIWQAAQASGFTWDDIADANGQSGGSGSALTLIYAPTIIAADATGVAQKLKEDKEELERWINERELKDKIAVYA